VLWWVDTRWGVRTCVGDGWTRVVVFGHGLGGRTWVWDGRTQVGVFRHGLGMGGHMLGMGGHTLGMVGHALGWADMGLGWADMVWGVWTSVAAFLSRLFFVLLIQSAVFIHILRS
jgi:hypothetical protein